MKTDLKYFASIVDKYDLEIAELYSEIDVIDHILSENILKESRLIHELQAIRADLEEESNLLVNRICALRKIEEAIELSKAKVVKKTTPKIKTPAKQNHKTDVQKGAEILKNILQIN